jgi:lysozyme|tara:strand:+ start:1124 stop:1621 length:498 start_codon:yes stop_codon:yes gene_type:complete
MKEQKMCIDNNSKSNIFNREKVVDMLIRNESCVLTLYQCKHNYNTIGVGRNLDVNGISTDEAMYMLNNDIDRVVNNLDNNWKVWRDFPIKAQMVCIDMAFHLGITGFMSFVETRKLMELKQWVSASEELLRSKYAMQTPTRANFNSRQLYLCQKKQEIKKIMPKD